jgi:hypothetical protein|nr:MAG TPA: Cag pathogenicity island protein [Caudoviricetes sp.]DAS26258.1 MAG TPA: Cag pathogenicity island protein [Caudoviricetes sp.]
METSNNSNEKTPQTKVIKAVNDIAGIISIIGLIGGVFLIIMGFKEGTEGYSYEPHWILIGSGIGVALNAAVIWAVLKMLLAIYSKLDRE